MNDPADSGPAIADDGVAAPWAATLADPRFAAAARQLAANLLQTCDEDERLSDVFKDAGRYMTAMSALYLHERSGLTLAALKMICAGSGFLSPGRARALLQFLIHIDYLSGDGAARGAAYVPTPRFMAGWRRHIELVLLAAAVLEPALVALAGALGDPAVMRRFLNVQSERLHALARGHDPFPALRRSFLHPYAGSQILWVLALADTQERFPPDGPIAFALAPTARRFGVTHVHVRRVIQQAEAEGMLRYDGRGAITLEQPGRQAIEVHFAFQLAELVASGLETLRRE